ncbi:GNAT family N-acetyltransferase [Niallia sp. FSL W8-0635]|uniref:GNAT family N-acetyltransferase n=1 Tax=Niallia sp. FSL W8-0635 TaxID=2975337 RepID=UPI0003329916|nr:putative GCN5-related N-acetyltransferase [Niallia nealsonii AAU1]SLL35498.1 sortase-like acyltransferase [Mycobacteroides abscessus subsp. abscessus]HEO8422007.1 N-acetyltransferase [Yersinia enterocolitica]
MSVKLEKILQEYWEEIATIYRLGIQSRHATFETSVPDWEKWSSSKDLSSSFVLVDEEVNRVIGWAAISKVSNRRVYQGVGEHSVYLHPDYHRKGYGRFLLEKLIEHSESNGYWTLQSGIFPENIASIQLHKSCGFRSVGIREKIGKLDGEWRDVVLMERRSMKY